MQENMSINSVNLIEYNCEFGLVELYHTHAK